MGPPKGEIMFLREPTHILLVILVLILLFGAKRLPDSARALGRSLRIFKGELKSGNAPTNSADGTSTEEGAPDKGSQTDGGKREQTD
jgi:TatA/E family protein of Tat protein translocase